MADTCAKCKKTAESVTIGGRMYCAGCGEPHSVAKSAPKRTMSDVGTRTRLVSARPASSLHKTAHIAKGGVVDLRTPRTEPAKIHTRTNSKVSTKAKTPTPTPAPNKHMAIPHAVSRSEKISHFHRPQNSVQAEVHSEPKVHPVAAHATAPRLPSHAETHHRAMTKLAAHHKASNHTVHENYSSLKRYGTVAAAVLIMGTYVWLQNFPKLELHSASSKAGFALTLPAYLPSSYSMNGPVVATNGSATISFKSPSTSEPLKISQNVTNWDSKSLRDNISSSKTQDFIAVEGQGLTIYLWGKNEAAWVYHGIRFGLEGTSKLSREQILKIAYSL
jgi:hypothetical protein